MDAVAAVEAQVAGVLASFASSPGGAEGLVLAVSGGLDSVVLLHAAVRVARSGVRLVATFDHGTGPHASAAVELVRAQAAALGLPLACGAIRTPARTEAEWRAARWTFLRAAAREAGGHAIATAHTRDDALETVTMRALRAASARGLAGLAAPGGEVVRPLLAVTRAEVAAYAAACSLRWAEDPANADRRFLRVRLRAELLPAIARLRPEVSRLLIAAGDRASALRRDVEAWVDAVSPGERVAVLPLAALSSPALAVFWPAYAARAGVRIDRRAVARLVAFTRQSAEHVRSGTAQPAWVPVAGRPAAAVALAHGSTSEGGAARVWHLYVRDGPESEAAVTTAHARPRPP